MTDYAPFSQGEHTPRPINCPICGLTADNGIIVASELTSTATYVDTAGHIFSLTWAAVA